MSFSLLYILFVFSSILLFNALIALARASRYVKDAPVEQDYAKLEEVSRELEKKISAQNQEIVELQMKITELEKSENESESANPPENTEAEAAAAESS